MPTPGSAHGQRRTGKTLETSPPWEESKRFQSYAFCTTIAVSAIYPSQEKIFPRNTQDTKLLTEFPRASEPCKVEPMRRHDPKTERGADAPGNAVPRIPASYFVLLIALPVRLIRAKPILAPFPDVAQHIAQPLFRVSVRIQPNGRRVPHLPFVVRARRVERRLIAPRITCALRSPDGPFPLGFGRQASSFPGAVGGRLEPTDTHYRTVWILLLPVPIFGFGATILHELAELLHGYRVTLHAERRKTGLVDRRLLIPRLGIVIRLLLFLLLCAHQEGNRWNRHPVVLPQARIADLAEQVRGLHALADLDIVRGAGLKDFLDAQYGPREIRSLRGVAHARKILHHGAQHRNAFHPLGKAAPSPPPRKNAVREPCACAR